MNWFSFAAALLLAPSISHERLKILRPRGRRRPRLPAPTTPVIVVAAAAVGLFAGLGGAVAGAVLAATLCRERRSAVAGRAKLTASAALATALAGFVAELKSGAHPATAARNAAQDAEPPATEVLTAIATTSARGGDVVAALADFPQARALTRAWRLSTAHGVPLASVLDEVRQDLERRVAFTRQVAARMAGPRASAGVLAVLPVLGVALGELTGAGPLAVLVTTVPGQFLLVLGVLLVCAGLRWSARLTRQVVP
ncbi:type II secretion system F family protein [Actinosynnema sp. NPDC020468]|uniref:type II secretion system F family protein n=1 Tax=Actinosynnema sp. NPDC020468 TaxID=3154488 RepID=UPI0033D0402B